MFPIEIINAIILPEVEFVFNGTPVIHKGRVCKDMLPLRSNMTSPSPGALHHGVYLALGGRMAVDFLSNMSFVSLLMLFFFSGKEIFLRFYYS